MAYFIHIGPFGKCPDCGEDTFVKKGSLLSEVVDTWEIPRDLMRLICRDIVRSYKRPNIEEPPVWLTQADYEKAIRERKLPKKSKRVLCSKCDNRAVQLHWLEPVDGAVIGPMCKNCLQKESIKFSDRRGYSIDYPVYVTAANKKVITMARASLMLGRTVHEDDELPDDDEVVLF